MKIFTNNIMNNHTDVRFHPKESSAHSAVSNEEHSFDAIIIQSDPRQIEERTFAKAVSTQLSSEIKKTASAEKINGLKNQISAHTYPIDAQAIASKILLV